jgi:hypothetical protein
MPLCIQHERAQGVAMFNDDHEPEQTSVEAEDLLAMMRSPP